MISGISVSPRRQHLGLYYLLFFDNIGQEEVALFLRELLRHLDLRVVITAGRKPPFRVFQTV